MKRHVIAFASLTNSCSMLMIWSSGERNRSCSPFSRRSRGFMHHPLGSFFSRENHASLSRGIPNRICKKTELAPHILGDSKASIPAITQSRQSLGNSSRATVVGSICDRHGGRALDVPHRLEHVRRHQHPIPLLFGKAGGAGSRSFD